jgi:ribosomal protein L11 methyltransferase
VRVRAAEAELARARFLTLAPEGFEEITFGDELELAAYTDGSGEERIRCAFPSAEATAVQPGWEERWREFHRGITVAGVWIGPPWERPLGDSSVVVEPGHAFGTGAHATTRACVELLATAARGSVLDAGCGSGVLSLAASRLGFGPVVAVDVDEAALEATRGNAARNGVELEVLFLDVLRDDLPAADLLVANIELAAVTALLRRWNGRRAITSGYLAEEQPEPPGWSGEERIELDGWAADFLARKTTV